MERTVKRHMRSFNIHLIGGSDKRIKEMKVKKHLIEQMSPGLKKDVRTFG